MLGSDLQLGMRTLEAYAPQRIEYRDDTFDCVVSTEQRGNLVTVGGKELEVSFTAFIRVNALGLAGSRFGGDACLTTADDTDITADNFTTRPRTGEIVRYQQRRYRIGDVRVENDEGVWRLELTSPMQ